MTTLFFGARHKIFCTEAGLTICCDKYSPIGTRCLWGQHIQFYSDFYFVPLWRNGRLKLDKAKRLVSIKQMHFFLKE